MTVDDRFLDRSLIYTKNNRGPKIDPWSMLPSTGDHEDDWAFNKTLWNYLIGSSQCILVVGWAFLKIAVYKPGFHARLNKCFGYVQKYASKRRTTVKCCINIIDYWKKLIFAGIWWCESWLIRTEKIIIIKK